MNMSHMLNIHTVGVRSDDGDAGKNHLLKLNPFKLQKVTKYALFYSSVTVYKISRKCCAIASLRNPSVLDI